MIMTTFHDYDILVVDDEPDNVELLIILLEELGYRTRSAFDGADALNAVKEKRPNLIMLDIQMPNMDGFEVAETLKRQPETELIPIIFISAITDYETMSRGFANKALDYIVKPFDFLEVERSVTQALMMQSTVGDKLKQ